MSTRPCPHCHEIIPADLDYCPYCNQNTRESLQTADDAALAQKLELREADPESALPPDSISEQGDVPIAPTPSVDRCIMCNMSPATVGDYCLECRNKLDMGPEQWDMVKQDMSRRNMLIGTIVAVVVLVLIIVLVSHLHHAARSTAPAPAASSAQ